MVHPPLLAMTFHSISLRGQGGPEDFQVLHVYLPSAALGRFIGEEGEEVEEAGEAGPPLPLGEEEEPRGGLQVGVGAVGHHQEGPPGRLLPGEDGEETSSGSSPPPPGGRGRGGSPGERSSRRKASSLPSLRASQSQLRVHGHHAVILHEMFSQGTPSSRRGSGSSALMTRQVRTLPGHFPYLPLQPPVPPQEGGEASRGPREPRELLQEAPHAGAAFGGSGGPLHFQTGVLPGLAGGGRVQSFSATRVGPHRGHEPEAPPRPSGPRGGGGRRRTRSSGRGRPPPPPQGEAEENSPGSLPGPRRSW